MNAFDVIVCLVLAGGLVVGLARGATRIVIGIATLLVAFFLASRYQDTIAGVLTRHHVAETPARVAAYVLVFLLTMIAGGLVAWIVGKILKLAMLSWADRLAGGALGLLGALLAAAFLIHPIAASSPEGSRLLAGSKSAPYISIVADLGNAVAPDAVARRYDEGMGVLRKVWRGEQPLPAVSDIKKTLTHAVEAGEKAVKASPAPAPKR